MMRNLEAHWASPLYRMMFVIVISAVDGAVSVTDVHFEMASVV